MFKSRRSFLKTGLLWLPATLAQAQFATIRMDKPFLAKTYGKQGGGAGSGPDPLWQLLISYWTMDENAGAPRLDIRQRLNDLCDLSTGCGNSFGPGPLPSNFPQGTGLLNFAAGPPPGDTLLTSEGDGPGSSDASLSPGGLPLLPTPSNPWCFSLWWKADQLLDAGLFCPIIGKTTSGYFSPVYSGGEYALYWGKHGDGKLTVSMTQGSGGTSDYELDWSADLTINTWYHTAFGFDGSVLWLQVNDGTRVTLAAPDGVTFNSGNPLTIGTNSVINGIVSHCLVDEMCYANGHSFTTAEVTRLYNGGSPLPPPFQ